MKKIATLALLAVVLLLGESFTGNGTDKTPSARNLPRFTLMIDAVPFDALASNSCTAQLINNSETASCSFLGKPMCDKRGHIHPTKLQIDYKVRGEALGDVEVEKITYQYNNETYNLLPGTAYVSITKIKWAADKKSFVMNADIFCKVKRSYVMEEFVPLLVIRGSVQNLTVAAPAS